MRDQKKALLLLLAAIVLGAGVLAYSVYHRVINTVSDAYAVWNVADMINDYMEQHDGRWPRGWDHLQASHDRLFGLSAEGFADLQARVQVDWSADPAILATAAEPKAAGQLPFRVIWTTSSSHAYYTEPNWLVWNYLHERTTTRPYGSSATRPTTNSSPAS